MQALGNERQRMPLPETSLLFSTHTSESTSVLKGVIRRSNSVTSGAANVVLTPTKAIVAEQAVGQLDFVLWQTHSSEASGINGVNTPTTKSKVPSSKQASVWQPMLLLMALI